MRRLRSVPSAKNDLRRLVAWYLSEWSTPPEIIVGELDRLSDTIVYNPQQYAKVDRCPMTRDVRIAISAKRKMVVIYETTGTEVIILCFSHKSAKRRPWRKRLNEV